MMFSFNDDEDEVKDLTEILGELHSSTNDIFGKSIYKVNENPMNKGEMPSDSATNLDYNVFNDYETFN